MSNEKNALSITRFKDMDIATLSDEDYSDYVLAKLMQSIIHSLEGSVPSDRVFNFLRFSVLSSFWEAREALKKR